MPTFATDPIDELRSAVERLSPNTRAAMLAAVRCPATRIIAGGYVERGGGVCPLLAAHRRGGRTHDDGTASSPFAAVWDRFTATPRGAPRPIEPAERRVLEDLLVSSLARERRRREAAERRERETREAVAKVRTGRAATLEALLSAPGDRNRAQDLARRAGWAWLGIYRRYDDYRAALAATGENGAGLVQRNEATPVWSGSATSRVPVAS